MITLKSKTAKRIKVQDIRLENIITADGSMPNNENIIKLYSMDLGTDSMGSILSLNKKQEQYILNKFNIYSVENLKGRDVIFDVETFNEFEGHRIVNVRPYNQKNLTVRVINSKKSNSYRFEFDGDLLDEVNKYKYVEIYSTTTSIEMNFYSGQVDLDKLNGTILKLRSMGGKTVAYSKPVINEVIDNLGLCFNTSVCQSFKTNKVVQVKDVMKVRVFKTDIIR